jgi:hypothetical protein
MTNEEPQTQQPSRCLQCGQEPRVNGVIGEQCQNAVRVAMVNHIEDPERRRVMLPWVLDPRYGVNSRTTPAQVLADIAGAN